MEGEALEIRMMLLHEMKPCLSIFSDPSISALKNPK